MKQGDYDILKEISGDTGLWTYFTNDLSDQDELKNWIEAGVKETKIKKRIVFLIVDKQTNSVAGSTSIGNISKRDKRIEIGWTWLGREFQGKGVNEAVKYLLLKYCFDELNCERVEFKTDILNKPARNALKRIGAVEEGGLRSHTLMTHKRRRDTIYYSILRHEWKEIQMKNNFLGKWDLIPDKS
ncbi:GNAT family N-acetyltransferase [Maribellus maritimus]|uniref:GNAT family N-acetyltransferase n=1 Tax=Maribellus maritimus TaxID=2870838 RepID=UPI001EEAB78A|nr:GNAT family protein [Maribellus maritimus]MCG6188323.1 GNAT family N-acetyltransferase [Maribellus maritimus]